MISICFVVEGYAEENFVNNALYPYLQSNITKTINVTVQNLNGGILSSKLIKCLINLAPQYDVVTTLIDLVGLDSAKITGYSEIMKNSNLSSQEKASQIQINITNMVNKKTNVIPHVQPHEFEALCFADIDGLAESDVLLSKSKSKIELILQQCNNSPESINTVPSKYPAKQLEKFGYTKSASNFAKYCSIENIKTNCPHFNQWTEKLLDILGK